ncbi:MAG: hypothetical protein HGA65_06800 [Oscillochloris sp.]|nr:hypothetical protein [Oscillochloris sp.]
MINSPYDAHANRLFSLNSHFDHWQLLPAQGSEGNFLAQRILTPIYQDNPSMPGGYFGGTLGYSVGCHSGYNVIDSDILLSTTDSALLGRYKADFAQAFNKQAGNWIGNTGYGYGTADGIDYSERLALLLTEELVRDVRQDIGDGMFMYTGSPIGMALVHAKQRYLRNSTSLSAYDAKALSVMTLYGLPFIHVYVNNPLAPPPEERQQGISNILAPVETNAPLAPLSGGLLERMITVTVNLGTSNYEILPRTGSRQIHLDTSNISVLDSFVQQGFVTPTLRLIDNNHQAGTPSLPTMAYDISALNQSGSDRLLVKDVVFVRGEYDLPIPFDPQITQIVTETDSPIIDTQIEPGFTSGVGIWYPDAFFGFSSVGVGTAQRDQLTATLAQFKAFGDGVTGQLRTYRTMVFKVYYADPAATSAALIQDEQAPVIHSVRVNGTTAATAASLTAELNTTDVQVVVLVDTSSGGTPIHDVSGVYLEQGTIWTPVPFELKGTTDGMQRYEATITLPPGQVRVLISVTDNAGNVSYYTAKGTFVLAGAQVYLPFLSR